MDKLKGNIMDLLHALLFSEIFGYVMYSALGWIGISFLWSIVTRPNFPIRPMLIVGLAMTTWPLWYLMAGVIVFSFSAIFGTEVETGLAIIKQAESITKGNPEIVSLSLAIGIALIGLSFYMTRVLIGFRRSEYVKG